MVQLSYFFNHAPDDKGLPGSTASAVSITATDSPTSTIQLHQESVLYSIYGMFQQMVYRDGEAGSQKGLTVWGETAIAPQSIVNFMPYFIGGGLSYQGVIPRRDNDITSAG